MTAMTSLLIPYATNPLLPDLSEIVIAAIVFVIMLTLSSRSSWCRGSRPPTPNGRPRSKAAWRRPRRRRRRPRRRLRQYKAQLAEARSEAAKIREEAKTQGTQIIAELREQAQAEAPASGPRAEAQLEAERTQVMTQLRSEIGGLATTLASRIVGESLDDDERARRTVDRFLADLEGDGEPTAWGGQLSALDDVLMTVATDARADGSWAASLDDSRSATDFACRDLFAVVDALEVPPRCDGCDRPGTPESARGASSRGCSRARSPTRQSSISSWRRRRCAGPGPDLRGRGASGCAGRADAGRSVRRAGRNRGRAVPIRSAGGVRAGLRNALADRAIDRSTAAGADRRAARRPGHRRTIVLAKRAVAARERSFGHTIEGYITLAAAQKNRVIATVRVAQPLTDRPAAATPCGSDQQIGRDVAQEVIDPDLLGGVRVELGNEVFEGPSPAAGGGPTALRISTARTADSN